MNKEIDTIEQTLISMGHTIPAPDKGRVDEIIAHEIAKQMNLLNVALPINEAKIYYVDFKERKLLATS